MTDIIWAFLLMLFELTAKQTKLVRGDGVRRPIKHDVTALSRPGFLLRRKSSVLTGTVQLERVRFSERPRVQTGFTDITTHHFSS